MKNKAIQYIGGAIALLIVILLARTFTPGVSQTAGESFDFQPDGERVTRLMSDAVKYKTIPTVAISHFRKSRRFIDYLERQFPLVHKNRARNRQ